MVETETHLWHRLLGGLPKGTLVKVQNHRFKKGYYYGKVVAFVRYSDGSKRFYYCIDQYPKIHGCNMWVKPENIIEVIKDETTLETWQS